MKALRMVEAIHLAGPQLSEWPVPSQPFRSARMTRVTRHSTAWPSDCSSGRIGEMVQPPPYTCSTHLRALKLVRLS